MLSPLSGSLEGYHCPQLSALTLGGGWFGSRNGSREWKRRANGKITSKAPKPNRVISSFR